MFETCLKFVVSIIPLRWSPIVKIVSTFSIFRSCSHVQIIGFYLDQPLATVLYIFCFSRYWYCTILICCNLFNCLFSWVDFAIQFHGAFYNAKLDTKKKIYPSLLTYFLLQFLWKFNINVISNTREEFMIVGSFIGVFIFIKK